MAPTNKETKHFEDEVRRIARALWPRAEFSGAAVLGRRETDGVFYTEECIHVIEATTSRSKSKALEDINKLNKNIQRFRNKGGTQAVVGWFVTREEPTADQRSVTDKFRHTINTMSFSHFQARLIDSKAYLSARDNYRFGSVRDPVTDKIVPTIEYVPLDIVIADSMNTISHRTLISQISEGKTVVLLGDYGAGKSMTLREIYRDLRRKHLKSQTNKFPVYINMRDHYGQYSSSEIINRHAEAIGYNTPGHLVRAWRAGYIHLLIDGFDEISTLGMQGLWRDLKGNRFRAMQPIRQLIQDHPDSAGLVIAGRASFFDNQDERRNALKLPQNAIELTLNEFTDEQVTTYLQRAGLSGAVPWWLPSRPLLVGYMAAKGLLVDFVIDETASQQIDQSTGWDVLLDRIADREAAIEAGIDGGTVRGLLERLSTKARATENGLGSLSPETIVQAFREVCGYPPDDRGMLLLQRLPGLGIDREEEKSRTFIDETFADACRAGDLAVFIKAPYKFPQSVLSEIASPVGLLGIDVARKKIQSLGFSEGRINAALDVARKAEAIYTTYDIAMLLSASSYQIQQKVMIDNIFIPEMEFKDDQVNYSPLVFKDCFISRLEIDSSIRDYEAPSFQQCYVNRLEGRTSKEDLPRGSFDSECVIETFSESVETTNQILRLDVPLGVRVCLTILKKLYEQAGSGRRENALYRGLDSHAQRLVPKVLQVLQSEGLAFPDKSKKMTVWRPDRSKRTRVGQIIVAPSIGEDKALQRCGQLES